jgi:hypothetical protein
VVHILFIFLFFVYFCFNYETYDTVEPNKPKSNAGLAVGLTFLFVSLAAAGVLGALYWKHDGYFILLFVIFYFLFLLFLFLL